MKKLFSTGHVLGGMQERKLICLSLRPAQGLLTAEEVLFAVSAHDGFETANKKKSLLNFYSNTENAFFLDNSSSNLIISQNILYKAFF